MYRNRNASNQIVSYLHISLTFEAHFQIRWININCETDNSWSKCPDDMDTADYPAYRPIHQTFCIRRINFDKRSLFGVVECKLKMHRFPLEKVTLNCRHARLYRVTLNGTKQIGFEYRDPTLLVCPDDIKQRNLDYFCGAYMQAIQATNFENGLGDWFLIFKNQF